MKECTGCGEVKTLDAYHNAKKGKFGKAAKCRDCKSKQIAEWGAKNAEHRAEANAKYRKENADKIRESNARYRERNKDEIKKRQKRDYMQNGDRWRRHVLKRRARKRELPDTLTSEQVIELHQHFEGKCALCDEPAEHLDHFIPLASGHGGTIMENMVPLCSTHNLSKGAKNPFEWAATLAAPERERFDSLVSYLTVINGIATVSEYEAHVTNCFK